MMGGRHHVGEKLKRLARYLVSHPRLTVNFEDTGTIPSQVRVYSESDWAGCLRTRRSTSGGCVMEHYAAYDRTVVK